MNVQGEGAERRKILNYCYKSELGSNGRIYFIDNRSCGGEQWQNIDDSKCFIRLFKYKNIHKKKNTKTSKN